MNDWLVDVKNGNTSNSQIKKEKLKKTVSFERVRKTGSSNNYDLFDKEVRDEQSATGETLLKYERRFENLWNRYRRETIKNECLSAGITEDEFFQGLAESGDEETLFNPRGFAKWIEKKAEHWEYSTTRQMRAASRHGLVKRFKFGANLNDAIVILNGLTKEGTKTSRRSKAKKLGKEITDDLLKETSGNKTKRIPPKHYVALLQYLEENYAKDLSDDEDAAPSRRAGRGQWLVRAVKMLVAGANTGLRPVEWATAIWEEPEEGDEDIAILRIRNAKHTNGRAHGEFRKVGVARNHPITNVVFSHLRDIQDFCLRTGKDVSYYTAECNRAIKEVCREIASKNNLKYLPFQMYTGRHQFSANLKKAGFSDGQVAYMMGHNSAKTAGEHYGRALSGHSRKTLGPLAPDVICTGELVADGPNPQASNTYSGGLKDLLEKSPDVGIRVRPNTPSGPELDL